MDQLIDRLFLSRELSQPNISLRDSLMTVILRLSRLNSIKPVNYFSKVEKENPLRNKLLEKILMILIDSKLWF